MKGIKFSWEYVPHTIFKHIKIAFFRFSEILLKQEGQQNLELNLPELGLDFDQNLS